MRSRGSASRPKALRSPGTPLVGPCVLTNNSGERLRKVGRDLEVWWWVLRDLVSAMTSAGFDEFYSVWLEEEKSLVDLLRKSVDDQKSHAEIGSLVDDCYRHYSKYVHAKIKAAQADVAYVAAGMWRTPLEAGFLWMGGWRPTTAIVLAYSLMGMQIENELRKLLDGIDVPSMAALSAKQLAKLNSMQQTTRVSEDDISNRLAMLQMLVADQQMARATSAEPPPSETCDLSGVREAMEPKLVGLRDLLIDAEQLRLQTLHEMVLVLTPVQAAQYAVAAFEMVMAVRMLGDQESEMYSDDFPRRRAHKTTPKLASQGQLLGLQDASQGGINLTLKDYGGKTLRHLAAAEGHAERVAFLIEHDTDLHKRDGSGTTSVLDALRGGRDANAQISVETGAGANAKGSAIKLCQTAATAEMGHGFSLAEAGQAGSEATLKLLEGELARRQDLHTSQDSGRESSEESCAPMEDVQSFGRSSWNENDAGSSC